jgi:rubrerythrin
MTQALTLDQALKKAMEAELQAAAFYAHAATEVRDPQGRDLLGRLASFEQYHYEQLVKLVESLQADGHFVAYETRGLSDFLPSGDAAKQPVPSVAAGEAAGTQVEKLEGVVSILTKAIANEKRAGELYRQLLDGTSDTLGQDMFRKLANEEMMHQRILEDEFFSLSNEGVWGWSGLYGE